MAAVIKQAATPGAIRALVAPVRHAVSVVDPRDEELAVLRAERARLEAEIAATRTAAARAAAAADDDLDAAVTRAREAALDEGRRAGLAAAEMRETDRVAAVADGVAAEATRLAARLEALDGLAASLARACLDRMFARPDAMAGMVTAALERHCLALRDGAALDVRVSGADFADTAALDAAVRAAGARATVSIDLDLPAGACRIAARLDRVDLDVPAQWAELARLLDGMAGA